MSSVKIGVIGVGNMGKSHATNIFKGDVPGAKLTAVCDLSSDHISNMRQICGDEVQYFNVIDQFFKEADIEAVIIATPHYSHPDLGVKAFENQLHVLVEKPIGVYTSSCKPLLTAAQKSDRSFAIMFNQRTNPLYQKAREILKSGQLGSLKRVHWTITDWYRSQAYYDSGAWRATWAGEGGGVLLNQCPHNLDLLQWICGMPSKIRAFCSFGKYHTIDVEDDVTAYLEYENGATGTFITSTGEYPGSNRLEIVGDKGKIIIENKKLILTELCESEREWNKKNKEAWGKIDHTVKEIEIEKYEISGHVGIMRNWVNNILHNEELLAPGADGINSLTLSNGMVLSTWQNADVELPLNEESYAKMLQEKIDSELTQKV